MILIDLSQIVKSAVAAISNESDITVEPGLIRHTALNSIRAIRLKHVHEYGEMILCADSMNGGNWRKDVFPFYKARRKVRYEESKIDWAAAMPMINSVFEELRDEFPYRFVSVDTAEADDVIGTICEKLGTDMPIGGEPILIVSSDKDFLQLQKYQNVSQFNNITGQMMYVDDAEKYLFEKILTGDSGDDVPNVRSADDHFMGDFGRQKPITKKIKEDFEAYKATDQLAEDRFERNKKVIDLSCTPEYIKDAIWTEFQKPAESIRRSRILTYLSKHRLRELIKHSSDF